MAYTISATQSYAQYSVTVELAYTTSTSGATHTVSLTSLTVTASGNQYINRAEVNYSVKYGSTTLISNESETQWGQGTHTVSLSKSASTTMTHAATSKTLTLSLGKGSVVVYLPTTGGYTVYSYETPAASKNAAVSIDARPSYSVTFDANGGSGAPSAQTKWYGENLALSSTKPTRAGYVFRRWNTNTSDTGTVYNPSASYTANAALALYAIWNPIIAYDANGGTGAPSAQTKTFGEALALQSGTPSRTGYAFNGWNTARDGSGTSYAAGATIAAGSNTAVTLYAQWLKLPDAPTISSLTVVRSNSSGTASDSGEYCKVTAKWLIDTTNVSGNTATVTGTIKPDNGSAVAFTFSSGASGISGTAQALVPNCDTDHQYTITVTVTDTRTSTSRVGIMTRAKFIIDLKAGGTAMGIGSAAPSDGLEVGWAAQFDKLVTMLMGLALTGDLSVSGTITNDALTVHVATSDIFSAASGWTVISQEARTYGRLCSVYVVARPTSEVAAKTSSSTTSIGTFASGYRPAVTQGFANQYGHGHVTSGGSAAICNQFTMGTSASVYIALTFIK